MRYLIDADIVAFKAATLAEKATDWGEGHWTLHADEAEAQGHVHDYLNRVSNRLGDGEFVLFLTGANNWRKDVLSSYKSNRKDVRKPMVLPAINDWMIETMGAVRVPTMEADDLLGIEATKHGGIIVSEDKDLKTVPCTLFNPAKDLEPYEIDEFTADYNHMTQTLCGDTTDGYSGLAGCGPKTAEKILEGCSDADELWDAVVKAYAKKKLSEEVALTMAQVARICRAEDYDFENRKAIPWQPPSL